MSNELALEAVSVTLSLNAVGVPVVFQVADASIKDVACDPVSD
jgi:hypothetical protein